MTFKTVTLLTAGLASIGFSALMLDVVVPLYDNTIGGNALMFLVFGYIFIGVSLICLAIKG
jgi:hypothetical protein